MSSEQSASQELSGITPRQHQLLLAMLAREIKRDTPMGSFMIRSGLLRDILNERSAMIEALRAVRACRVLNQGRDAWAVSKLTVLLPKIDALLARVEGGSDA